MNNVHDMGGLQGFGPIQKSTDKQVFHHAWEARAFAVTMAMNSTRHWNIDKSRSLRESLPPARYLSNTYYQIWLDGLERLLVHAQLVSAAELKAGHAQEPGRSSVKALRAEDVQAFLKKGYASSRPAVLPARFKVGDKVRTRLTNPLTHTRLPRYCRDKVGVVIKVNDVFVFPDKNAHGPDEPQWMYTIEFDARTLWGEDSTASSVCLNCWEPYLMET
jgi:nitrile hydratase beta subunit